MTAADAILIVLAGMGAGTINTVVGSGSLITFPTLIALGYPPVLANVSNNIGLVPGSVSGVIGYRHEVRAQLAVVRRLVPASMLGSLLGASLLLVTSGGVFEKVVSVLIVGALVLVVIQPALSRRLQVGRAVRSTAGRLPVVVFPLVALAGVYGGYFGAAQGIVLIALLGILVSDDLQQMNAVKNVLAGSVNLMASVVFIASTDVDWRIVGCVAAGSTIGAQVGARVGRSLSPVALRVVIVIVGIAALVRLAA